jgi:hypothetical protein
VRASAVRWILAAFGVLAVSLAVASSGLKGVAKAPGTAGRTAMAADSSRVRQTVSFRRDEWSRVLVDAATASGAGLAELNGRPDAFASATYTGDKARLVETLAELEKRGAPLRRAWFGPTVSGADSVTGFGLMVELERPDVKRR